MTAFQGDILCGLQSLLGFLGHFVDIHKDAISFLQPGCDLLLSELKPDSAGVRPRSARIRL
jgi:hypothetical protein